jgi:hypothetical protein
MNAQISDLIQAALCAQLKTPDITTPVTPIAWPLVAYTPVIGITYLEVHPLLKAQTQHSALAFGGSDINRGIFQVDAVVPEGKGEAAALRLVDLIIARFALGTELVAGGRMLRVNAPPQSAAALRDAPWVRYPVSIPYVIIT